jgi:NADH-quinone oxidoreductase subunit L
MEFIIETLVFLPLIGALIVGLNTKNLSVSLAQFITTGFLFISAILAWVLFYKVIIGGNKYIIDVSKWVSSGDFNATWQLKIDALTSIMLTLVCTVSALVHLYSVGYMSHDEHPQRFMSYLSLFTFCMIMLVTSNNLLQLFFGWEGVGLCSYLLIGFWYKKPSANAAAMKAFIVNRVGDFGLAIGLFATYLLFGSIGFEDIFSKLKSVRKENFEILGCTYNTINFICVALFIGCMGKSAQLGLHTWLPDAMEGPTPVSALIHAATMVTAGIFLVARLSPLFQLSEVALNMITIVGATTAIFAATIALTQNDIKKIIAYSTCSQLGYMFFACGVSAYSAGIFHLYTHGFFKALLFLSAGSVIHAMSDEQDIQKMGALWNKIPLTYTMMLIGTLAITGFPYLSGYFSKDLVLEVAFAKSQTGSFSAKYAFWVGISAAFLTAFYSWRLILLTFHGEFRNSNEVKEHIHESPISMTLPLIILSIGALIVGYIFAKKLGIGNEGLKFWGGALKEGFITAKGEKESIYKLAHHVPGWVKKLPMLVGFGGFVLAFLFYIIAPKIPYLLAKSFSFLYKISYNKWYIDEIYNFLFVCPIIFIGKFFWKKIDTKIIDGLGPNGFAYLSDKFGLLVKTSQTGYIYTYSFVMLFAVLVSLGYFVYLFIGF